MTIVRLLKFRIELAWRCIGALPPKFDGPFTSLTIQVRNHPLAFDQFSALPQEEELWMILFINQICILYSLLDGIERWKAEESFQQKLRQI